MSLLSHQKRGGGGTPELLLNPPPGYLLGAQLFKYLLEMIGLISPRLHNLKLEELLSNRIEIVHSKWQIAASFPI